MSNTISQLDRRTGLGAKHRGLRTLRLWIPVLLLCGLAGRGTANSAEVPSGSFTPVGPGAQFAIADFDGDLRPDLASIQAEPNSSGTTDYWIQLQLSSVGRQLIRIVAPSGGLRIETRDVNGDNTIDLVLAEAWFNQPVAIFLNNGHGGFSRAEPTAFPGTFRENQTNWASATDLATDTIGVPPQSGSSIRVEENDVLTDRSPARWIPAATIGRTVSAFLVSQAGRAPPSEVPRF